MWLGSGKTLVYYKNIHYQAATQHRKGILLEPVSELPVIIL